jgi:malonyl-CoA O-methyltransferase
MDKKTVARNFSGCALTYDRYADLQKQTGVELLALIKNNGIRNILEIGCGTGNYTLLLRKKFPDARIQAIDISDKMIEVASLKFPDMGIEFMAADAERADLEGGFDLITANASFQWFDDFAGTLGKYKYLLNPAGTILFSIFGPKTFRELNASLEEAFQGVSAYSANFMAADTIKGILNKQFRQVKTEETRYEESFSSRGEIINKIKNSRIRGEGWGAKARVKPPAVKKLGEV